jgi:hypothetical protein
MERTPRYDALVHWTDESQEQMGSISVSRLVHPAHFVEDGPRWPTAEGWSVVLEFDAPPSIGATPSRARVSFLFPTAPHERLRPGRSFDYYMGLHKIARVDVGERIE